MSELTQVRPARIGFGRRLVQSDLFYSFRRSPLTIASAVVSLILILSAVFAPWVAPHDPFDPGSISIMDSFYPPVWSADGQAAFLLGSDDQGRDVLSTILYGMRISLAVGFASEMRMP